MIARRVPRAGVFVGKHRYLSCVQAKAAGFDLAVLDDGFQHLKLGRDLDIVLHDAASAPLREGLSALGRADILLWKGGAGAERLERLSGGGFRSLRLRVRGQAGESVRLLDFDAALPPGLSAGSAFAPSPGSPVPSASPPPSGSSGRSRSLPRIPGPSPLSRPFPRTDRRRDRGFRRGRRGHDRKGRRQAPRPAPGRARGPVLRPRNRPRPSGRPSSRLRGRCGIPGRSAGARP